MKKISSLVAILLCIFFNQVSSQQQLFTPKKVGSLKQQQQQQSWSQFTIVQNSTLAQPILSTLAQNTQVTSSKGLVRECIQNDGLKSCLMDLFKDNTEINHIDFKYILEAITLVSERSLQYCYDVFTKKVCDTANELNGLHHKSPSQNQPWPRPPINHSSTMATNTTTKMQQLKQNIQRPILQSESKNNTILQQQKQNPENPVNVTIRYNEGSTYIGHLSNGKRNGKGTFTFPSGEKYEGDWLNDEMSGNGTYHFFNGDLYEGNWARGQRNGFGKYISKNGSKYFGGWLNSLREGNGTYYFANGDRLVGQFKNDQAIGMCTYYWKNGDFYHGEWANGNKIGVGNYTYANGKIAKGRWDKNNLFVKI